MLAGVYSEPRMNAIQIAALRAETAYEVIEDPHVAAAKIWAETKAMKQQIAENARVAKSKIDKAADLEMLALTAATPALVKRMWEQHADQVIAADKVIAWQARHRTPDSSDDQML